MSVAASHQMPWKIYGNVGFGGGGLKPLVEGLEPPTPALLATGLLRSLPQVSEARHG